MNLPPLNIAMISLKNVMYFMYFLIFSALFVALLAQDGFEKRGGDARFATGVMGSSFNRIGNYNPAWRVTKGLLGLKGYSEL